MADTAIKSEEEKKEYFDKPAVLEQKVNRLAEMILNSRHFVAFTGAGISTACGIPDYRSGFDTVLETGPGCWETQANVKKYEQAQNDMAFAPARPSSAGATRAAAEPSRPASAGATRAAGDQKPT